LRPWNSATESARQNTLGTSSRSGWNIFERWREKKGMIVLIRRSGAFLILNLAGLSEPERNQLHTKK
jgi:hypothetical protein